jgi:glycosyltransferase involved in cell wall biosynthesis
MIGDRPVEGKVPLSVAIITKNEEEMLPSCLKSVSFADEIVVVDSGSTDRTIEVAKEYGCRVFVEQWKGFGLQKLSAIEKCTHDWILVLDADERIPDETRAEVTRVIEEPKAQAYSFPRKRLFRKGGATISGRLVHEAIEADSTAKIAAPIYHYPDTSASGVRRKMDAYSSAGAEQLFSEGKRSSICKAVSSGLAAFLKCYFLKLGMLDGKAGFIIAVNDGIYAYYKYSRLLELQERAQG